jgi:hypothetical protein
MVLGATVRTGVADFGETEEKLTAMELALRRALGNETVLSNRMTESTTDYVDCPHCSGKTVCNVDNTGSCVRCLVYNGQTQAGITVICSVCNGLGEIEMPADRTVCRHCSGTSICRHGIDATSSCHNCWNYGRQDQAIRHPIYRSLYLEKGFSMCSVCKGRGFIAPPGIDKRVKKNNQ